MNVTTSHVTTMDVVSINQVVTNVIVPKDFKVPIVHKVKYINYLFSFASGTPCRSLLLDFSLPPHHPRFFPPFCISSMGLLWPIWRHLHLPTLNSSCHLFDHESYHIISYCITTWNCKSIIYYVYEYRIISKFILKYSRSQTDHHYHAAEMFDYKPSSQRVWSQSSLSMSMFFRIVREPLQTKLP